MLNKKQRHELLSLYGDNYISMQISILKHVTDKTIKDKCIYFTAMQTAYYHTCNILGIAQRATKIKNYIDTIAYNNLVTKDIIKQLENISIKKVIKELEV